MSFSEGSGETRGHGHTHIDGRDDDGSGNPCRRRRAHSRDGHGGSRDVRDASMASV